MGDEGRHAPRDEKGDPAAGAPVSRYHAQHPGARPWRPSLDRAAASTESQP
jgi:hypothetical protein